MMSWAGIDGRYKIRHESETQIHAEFDETRTVPRFVSRPHQQNVLTAWTLPRPASQGENMVNEKTEAPYEPEAYSIILHISEGILILNRLSCMASRGLW
jgi:hypothetical protein